MDAEFVAHAREDIPWLLNHVDALTQRLQAREAELAQVKAERPELLRNIFTKDADVTHLQAQLTTAQEEIAKLTALTKPAEGVWYCEACGHGQDHTWNRCAQCLRAKRPEHEAFQQAHETLQAEHAALHQRIEQLATALRSLRNEARGLLAWRDPLMEAAGITNIRCLERRCDEADAALLPVGEPPCAR